MIMPNEFPWELQLIAINFLVYAAYIWKMNFN